MVNAVREFFSYGENKTAIDSLNDSIASRGITATDVGDGMMISIHADHQIFLAWDDILELREYMRERWKDKAKNKKRYRNSIAYEVSRSPSGVIYRTAVSDLHSYRMSVEDWEALPNV